MAQKLRAAAESPLSGACCRLPYVGICVCSYISIPEGSVAYFSTAVGSFHENTATPVAVLLAATHVM